MLSTQPIVILLTNQLFCIAAAAEAKSPPGIPHTISGGRTTRSSILGISSIPATPASSIDRTSTGDLQPVTRYKNKGAFHVNTGCHIILDKTRSTATAAHRHHSVVFSERTLAASVVPNKFYITIQELKVCRATDLESL